MTKEERSAYNRAYWEAHKGETSAYEKAVRYKRSKAYRQAHRDRTNAQSRAYWDAHRDEINARRRTRYAEKKKAEKETQNEH